MKKRLIELSLPHDAISAQSAREKSIRHGHISTLHIWWARRPLAALGHTYARQALGMVWDYLELDIDQEI